MWPNAMLLRTVASFDEAQMATLQHALIRGIEIVAELEAGELLGEPLPTRNKRNAILLYEATEGGAGVLNRLVSNPSRMADIAREALRLMHYIEPFEAEPLAEADDACVAGCYRCLLSYFNQTDHEAINRRDAEVVDFLRALTRADSAEAESGKSADPWVVAIDRWKLPAPSERQIDGISYPLYWKTLQLLAFPGSPPETVRERCDDLGIDLISVPTEPGQSAPQALVTALESA